MEKLSLEKADGDTGAEERSTLKAIILNQGQRDLIGEQCSLQSGCDSPIVLLLGREGPGDVQGVNLPNGHDCK